MTESISHHLRGMAQLPRAARAGIERSPRGDRLSAGRVSAAGSGHRQAWALRPLSVDNPLGSYPCRDWKKVYLDQYRYDRRFTWICHLNDTHMCRMMAYKSTYRLSQNSMPQSHTPDAGKRRGGFCYWLL